jgi:mRNA-degrading endonuclease RelE of RelBE toxin-antitoxin system
MFSVDFHKDFTKKLLDLINTFRNIAEYKISIQKAVAFPYTNNE